MRAGFEPAAAWARRRRSKFALVLSITSLCGLSTQALAETPDRRGSVVVDPSVDLAYNSGARLAGIELGADGTLIAAGTGALGGHTTFALARFNAATAELDSAFGASGFVVQPVPAPEADSSAEDMALQPDGKIVVAGSTSAGPDGERAIAVARFNQDGTLDTDSDASPGSFGNDGIVVTSISPPGPGESGYDVANAVAIDPASGDILVAGTAFFPPTRSPEYADPEFVVVRYNSDGTLDQEFGHVEGEPGSGFVTGSFGNGWPRDIAYDVSIQPDGKILVAGETYFMDTTGQDFGLARLDGTSGLPDPAFGDNGVVTASSRDDYSTDVPRAIALQADGKIVMVGWTRYGSDEEMLAMRFNSDGGLDTADDADPLERFSLDGIVRLHLSFNGEEANDVVVQPDGKLVLVGTSMEHDFPFVSRFAAARLNHDGTLDSMSDDDPNSSFFDSGFTIFPVSPLDKYTNDYAVDAELAADGDVLIGGSASGARGILDFGLSRLSPWGAPRLGFQGDEKPPEVQIYDSSFGPRLRAATFSFSADEDSVFECRVDNGFTHICVGSFATGRLERGEHVFKVRATDRWSNSSRWVRLRFIAGR
jgi:uncharacterized delta-60 repeat protein